MGSDATRRGRRPASVAITILLLALAYWLMPAPNDSTPNSHSEGPVSTSALDSSSGSAAPQTRSSERNVAEVEGAERGSGSEADAGELVEGLLRPLPGRRYLSPAGLVYAPGSAEGHRLEHLRRHTEDDPDRPGSHGVFDGGLAGALRTIDLAFERAKSGRKTTTQVDDDRTIYTVDLETRVGYVGGSSGRRRSHPPARRVRLVLEGNKVVTAFPL